jgi:hypothetical protein
MIAQVKEWLPDPVKGIAWYGYGHPATTYLTPLWPIMKKLPEFYETGSRYEVFQRDSGCWINTYTQRMAELRWDKAIQYIREFRDPILFNLYDEAAAVQERAAEIYEAHNRHRKHPEVPWLTIKLIHDFAYDNAVACHCSRQISLLKIIFNYNAGFECCGRFQQVIFDGLALIRLHPSGWKRQPPLVNPKIYRSIQDSKWEFLKR